MYGMMTPEEIDEKMNEIARLANDYRYRAVDRGDLGYKIAKRAMLSILFHLGIETKPMDDDTQD
jgi:hypothetical protein